MSPIWLAGGFSWVGQLARDGAGTWGGGGEGAQCQVRS